eukprot:m51a1_g10904 hypothetical protein (3154) ;mRNA; f:41450-54937
MVGSKITGVQLRFFKVMNSAADLISFLVSRDSEFDQRISHLSSQLQGYQFGLDLLDALVSTAKCAKCTFEISTGEMYRLRSEVAWNMFVELSPAPAGDPVFPKRSQIDDIVAQLPTLSYAATRVFDALEQPFEIDDAAREVLLVLCKHREGATSSFTSFVNALKVPLAPGEYQQAEIDRLLQDMGNRSRLGQHRAVCLLSERCKWLRAYSEFLSKYENDPNGRDHAMACKKPGELFDVFLEEAREASLVPLTTQPIYFACSSVVLAGDTGVGKTELLNVFSLIINNDPNVVPDLFSEGQRLLKGLVDRLPLSETNKRTLASRARSFYDQPSESRSVKAMRELLEDFCSEAKPQVNDKMFCTVARRVVHWTKKRLSKHDLVLPTEFMARVLSSKREHGECPLADLDELGRFFEDFCTARFRSLFNRILMHQEFTSEQFHECTSTQIMGILKEVLVDHRLDGTPLPRNIFWVAALNRNPVEQEASAVIDYGVAQGSTEAPAPVYAGVRPAPPSLELLVVDFKPLSPSQQVQFMTSLLDMRLLLGHKVGSTQSQRDTLKELTLLCHEFVRELQLFRVHVSIRDLVRTVNLYSHLRSPSLEELLLCAPAHVVARGPEFLDDYYHWKALLLAVCLSYCADAEVDAVYESAEARQESYDASKIGGRQRCVVLVDEAGLPADERSALKALHYRLDHPRVASVVLTNRVLDAAKTNRALNALCTLFVSEVNSALALAGEPQWAAPSSALMTRGSADVLRESLSERVEEGEDPNTVPFRYAMLLDPTDSEASVSLLFDLRLLDRGAVTVVHAGAFANDNGAGARGEAILGIKKAMASGHTVVLVNADDNSVTSLYDVLNRHFDVLPSADRPGACECYANVAVGSFSRPCLVHPAFRIIMTLVVTADMGTCSVGQLNYLRSAIDCLVPKAKTCVVLVHFAPERGVLRSRSVAHAVFVDGWDYAYVDALGVSRERASPSRCASPAAAAGKPKLQYDIDPRQWLSFAFGLDVEITIGTVVKAFGTLLQSLVRSWCVRVAGAEPGDHLVHSAAFYSGDGEERSKVLESVLDEQPWLVEGVMRRFTKIWARGGLLRGVVREACMRISSGVAVTSLLEVVRMSLRALLAPVAARVCSLLCDNYSLEPVAALAKAESPILAAEERGFVSYVLGAVVEAPTAAELIRPGAALDPPARIVRQFSFPPHLPLFDSLSERIDKLLRTAIQRDPAAGRTIDSLADALAREIDHDAIAPAVRAVRYSKHLSVLLRSDFVVRSLGLTDLSESVGAAESPASLWRGLVASLLERLSGGSTDVARLWATKFLYENNVGYFVTSFAPLRALNPPLCAGELRHAITARGGTIAADSWKAVEAFTLSIAVDILWSRICSVMQPPPPVQPEQPVDAPGVATPVDVARPPAIFAPPPEAAQPSSEPEEEAAPAPPESEFWEIEDLATAQYVDSVVAAIPEESAELPAPSLSPDSEQAAEALKNWTQVFRSFKCRLLSRDALACAVDLETLWRVDFAHCVYLLILNVLFEHATDADDDPAKLTPADLVAILRGAGNAVAALYDQVILPGPPRNAFAEIAAVAAALVTACRSHSKDVSQRALEGFVADVCRWIMCDDPSLVAPPAGEAERVPDPTRWHIGVFVQLLSVNFLPPALMPLRGLLRQEWAVPFAVLWCRRRPAAWGEALRQAIADCLDLVTMPAYLLAIKLCEAGAPRNLRPLEHLLFHLFLSIESQRTPRENAESFLLRSQPQEGVVLSQARRAAAACGVLRAVADSVQSAPPGGPLEAVTTLPAAVKDAVHEMSEAVWPEDWKSYMMAAFTNEALLGRFLACKPALEELRAAEMYSQSTSSAPVHLLPFCVDGASELSPFVAEVRAAVVASDAALARRIKEAVGAAAGDDERLTVTGKYRMGLLLSLYLDVFAVKRSPEYASELVRNVQAELDINDAEMRAYQFFLNGQYPPDDTDPLADLFSDRTHAQAAGTDTLVLAQCMVNILAVALGCPRDGTHLWPRAFQLNQLHNTRGPGSDYDRQNWDCGYQIDEKGQFVHEDSPPPFGNSRRLRLTLNAMTWGAICWSLLLDPGAHTVAINNYHFINYWNEDGALGDRDDRKKVRSYIYSRAFAFFLWMSVEPTFSSEQISAVHFHNESLAQLWLATNNGGRPNQRHASWRAVYQEKDQCIDYERLLKDEVFDVVAADYAARKQRMQAAAVNDSPVLEQVLRMRAEASKCLASPVPSYAFFEECASRLSGDSRSALDLLERFRSGARKELKALRYLPDLASFYTLLNRLFCWRVSEEEARSKTLSECVQLLGMEDREQEEAVAGAFARFEHAWREAARLVRIEGCDAVLRERVFELQVLNVDCRETLLSALLSWPDPEVDDHIIRLAEKGLACKQESLLRLCAGRYNSDQWNPHGVVFDETPPEVSLGCLPSMAESHYLIMTGEAHEGEFEDFVATQMTANELMERSTVSFNYRRIIREILERYVCGKCLFRNIRETFRRVFLFRPQALPPPLAERTGGDADADAARRGQQQRPDKTTAALLVDSHETALSELVAVIPDGSPYAAVQTVPRMLFAKCGLAELTEAAEALTALGRALLQSPADASQRTFAEACAAFAVDRGGSALAECSQRRTSCLRAVAGHVAARLRSRDYLFRGIASHEQFDSPLEPALVEQLAQLAGGVCAEGSADAARADRWLDAADSVASALLERADDRLREGHVVAEIFRADLAALARAGAVTQVEASRLVPRWLRKYHFFGYMRWLYALISRLRAMAASRAPPPPPRSQDDEMIGGGPRQRQRRPAAQERVYDELLEASPPSSAFGDGRTADALTPLVSPLSAHFKSSPLLLAGSPAGSSSPLQVAQGPRRVTFELEGRRAVAQMARVASFEGVCRALRVDERAHVPVDCDTMKLADMRALRSSGGRVLVVPSSDLVTVSVGVTEVVAYAKATLQQALAGTGLLAPGVVLWTQSGTAADVREPLSVVAGGRARLALSTAAPRPDVRVRFAGGAEAWVPPSTPLSELLARAGGGPDAALVLAGHGVALPASSPVSALARVAPGDVVVVEHCPRSALVPVVVRAPRESVVELLARPEADVSALLAAALALCEGGQAGRAKRAPVAPELRLAVEDGEETATMLDGWTVAQLQQVLREDYGEPASDAVRLSLRWAQ